MVGQNVRAGVLGHILGTAAWHRAQGVPARTEGRIGSVLAVLGGVLVAAVAGAQLLAPPDLVIIGLTLLGPLTASLAASWRQTLAVAVLALLVAVLLGIPEGIFVSGDHRVRLGLVASAGALCVYAAAQREQRAAATQRLAHVAEVAQKAMLRPPPGVLGDIAMAGRYVSASDEALVGGDLYETAYTPYGVRVIVGDVRGKGLDGIRLAAVVLATFRQSMWDHDLEHLARTIDARVTREASPEDFVTAVMAEFPAKAGVAVVNCGHHPPLRLRATLAEELAPAEPTTPLGLGPRPRVERYPFEVGDRLLLCTDGILEGRDRGGAFFPIGEHVGTLTLPGLGHALDTLLERFVDHTGDRIDDDLAVLLAERLPRHPAGAPGTGRPAG